MLPILQVGPLAVQLPGLLLLLGVWLGLRLAEGEALRLAAAARPGDALPPNPDTLYNLAFVGLLAGLVGARLAHAARFPQAYLADPLGLISLSPAALAPAEGALIGALAAALYGGRRGLAWRPTLDALAPFAAVMGIALAGAHLSSGDAFGAPTDLPWRIWLWDEYRHPSQIYELAAALAILAGWRLWSRRAPAGTGAGMVFVLAWTAAARLLLEAFRGDSLLLPGGWRAAQVAALLILAACLAIWPRLLQRPPDTGAGAAHAADPPAIANADATVVSPAETANGADPPPVSETAESA